MNSSSATTGWKETTFGELVSTVSTNNKKIQKREYLESGRFPVVDQGQQFIGGYCNDESKVISEDLPLLVFGDHTRAFKYLDQPFVPGADGVKVLKPLRVNAKWLYHVAHALDFPDKGYARHFQYLKNAKLRVPSLSEQRCIVEEIEKQFSRLDAGVVALRRVQANLNRYRAAVLKGACEGRLVPTEAELAKAEGRAFETGEQLLVRILADRRKNWHGRGKYKEPVAPEITTLAPLPADWAWATVEQLNIADRPCAYGVLQPGDDTEGGVLFIRVGDISDGKVDQAHLKRIAPSIAAKYPRTKLQGGEFAITLVGAIGRTAVIPASLEGGNVARAVGVVPLMPQLNRHWVEIWFRNPQKITEMTAKSHEVARKTLNLEDVRAASVALPPLTEQVRVVAEVERRLSVIEKLEAAVATNLQHATRLRQSILQRAFAANATV